MSLREIRLSLEPKVSQEDMARTANITLQTYRKAEGLKSIKYSTAIAILNVLNEILKTKGRNQVTLDDLNLTLN